MENEFDIVEQYKKEREPNGEIKYLGIGIAILTVSIILDWELFQWIYAAGKVTH